MANKKQGNLTVSLHQWKHLRPFGKRAFWKAERVAQEKAVPERIADDYTVDEFMADSCTEEHPCGWCHAQAEA